VSLIIAHMCWRHWERSKR